LESLFTITLEHHLLRLQKEKIAKKLTEIHTGLKSNGYLEHVWEKNAFIFEIQFWVKCMINKMLFQTWRFRIFCSQGLAKFRNDALGVETGERNASFRKKSQRSKICIRNPLANM
jgi:hypothetical protein